MSSSWINFISKIILLLLLMVTSYIAAWCVADSS